MDLILTFQGKTHVFETMAEKEKVKRLQQIYQALHTPTARDKEYPRCACRKTSRSSPEMNIKKQGGSYVISNLPQKGREHQQHAFHCPKARNGYRQQLQQESGISIDEEDVISCQLKKTEAALTASTSEGSKLAVPREVQHQAGHRRSAAISTLGLTILEEIGVGRYDPTGPRNIAGRLYYRLKDSLHLDRERLPARALYLATKSFKLHSGHRFIIGWGNITHSPDTYKGLYKVSLYDIDEGHTKLSDCFVRPEVYDNAIHNNHLRLNWGTEGYWIARRVEKRKNGRTFLDVAYLAFLPADPVTKIPVDSTLEQTMLQHLAASQRTFKKPLIGNLLEEVSGARPDMLLRDTNPETVIEVAGMKHEAYQATLEKKRKLYQQNGYVYVEWDGQLPVNRLPLPAPHHSERSST